MFQLLGYAVDFAGVVLSIAYIVEWKLGRVQLRQSYADIRLVFKQIADQLRGK